MSIKTAIIGASGYTGSELLRVLSSHPEFDVQFATANSKAGQSVHSLYPHLPAFSHLRMEKIEDVQSDIDACDLVFIGLPHGKAMDVAPSLKSKVVIDLGSDFRLKDPALYQTWYKNQHSIPEELPSWTYGLCELFRDDIKKAKRIANPGCYPTATILALAPLLKEGLIESPITVDALSGTSGAGRSPSEKLHFAHVFEDLRAYKVTSHQHTPEIEMALSNFSGKETLVSFTAHLAPMTRGIHATCSATGSEKASRESVFNALFSAYENEPFVTVTDETPGTKQVRGSNHVVIAPYYDRRTNRVIVTSVIDNLVKGAAGQAIQNANIIFDLPEDCGLTTVGVYP